MPKTKENLMRPKLSKFERQLKQEHNARLAREKKEASKPTIETVSADWKDIEGLAEGFKEALKSFGITVIDHPDCEGSDQYGFILSNRPLTEEEIKEQCIDRDEA